MEDVGMMKDIPGCQDWQFRPEADVGPAGDRPGAPLQTLRLLAHDLMSASWSEVRIHRPVDAASAGRRKAVGPSMAGAAPWPTMAAGSKRHP
jgi:hypothetical protein